MTDPAPLADRYGDPPRRRRRWLVPALGALVLCTGLGIAYLGWSKYGPDDIQAEQLGYTVVDDSTVSVRIKVIRADREQPVVCFVRAMSRDGVEVGRREILLGPAPRDTVAVTTTVRTSERPSSGSVYACSARVPDYLTGANKPAE